MFDRILVVCVGNICRSPVGAALLQRAFPDKRVQSAGLAALVDAEADKLAAEYAAADGLDLSAHRARQLEDELVRDADLVLVMTRGQQRALLDSNPAHSGKVMLFGQWLDEGEGGYEGQGQGRDIADPMGKSREVFQQTHRLLVKAAAAWQQRLADKKPDNKANKQADQA